MRRGFAIVSSIVVVLVAGSRDARAEEVDPIDVLATEAELFAEQVHRKLDMISIGEYTAGEFLGSEGLDAQMDMQVDLARRRARISLGGGDDRVLALRIDARIALDRGMPRIKGRIDLGVAGKRISLSLPEITVVPKSYEGEIYLQYNIPLIEGRF